ncbi:MAG: flagellar motor protein MotB [Kineosporiaceae bacterium]
MAGGGKGHGGKRGRKGGHHEEEHENHERWLVSYADMMTLLMALFLVMFAMSTVDKVKFEQLAHGLAEGFGKPEYAPLEGGDGILQAGDDEVDPVPLDALALAIPAVDPGAFPGDLPEGSDDTTAGNPPAATLEARARAEAQRLQGIAEAADSGLAAAGLDGSAQYRIDERGLVIALVTDGVLFRNGSAVLEPDGLRILDAVAPALRDLPQTVDVEGHANHLPLRAGSTYPSNWELSAARAASVVRHLIEADGLDPANLSAVGYSDTRPMVPREDPAAIERNRRVDIVVVSSESPEVRALLPAVAAPTGAAP